MDIRKSIYKVASFASELERIDYNITMLKTMANAILEIGVEDLDVFIDTLPNSGARPTVQPLYPAKPRITFPEFLEEDEKPPEPIGFQRFYNPNDLAEGGLLISMEMDKTTVLAIIDTAINRLNKKKTQIFKDSRSLINDVEIVRRPGTAGI
jgi:hypothetical protein